MSREKENRGNMIYKPKREYNEGIRYFNGVKSFAIRAKRYILSLSSYFFTFPFMTKFTTKKQMMEFVKTIRNCHWLTDIWEWFGIEYLAFRINSYLVQKGEIKVFLRNINDLHNYIKNNTSIYKRNHSPLNN